MDMKMRNLLHFFRHDTINWFTLAVFMMYGPGTAYWGHRSNNPSLVTLSRARQRQRRGQGCTIGGDSRLAVGYISRYHVGFAGAGPKRAVRWEMSGRKHDKWVQVVQQTDSGDSDFTISTCSEALLLF
jgi:hypothetical protein